MVRFLVIITACALSLPAHAYVHFSGGFGGSKWGVDPTAGTPAVVTWGFMPDGTAVEPSFELDPWNFPGQTGFSGTSNLSSLRQRIDVTQGHGAGAFDAALQRAFATWSEVANIVFIGPITDPGLPFPSTGATTPDIRIGAFMPAAGHSFNNVGAVGFGPPGFGPDPLAGDIIFNLGANFDIVVGTEDVTPLPWVNDLEGLFLHELGHAAIGLGHPSWDGETPDQRVMYVGDYEKPEAPFCCETINRELHPDDIAGAWYAYGIRGDYNSDGVVNAADYTVWRDGLGDDYVAGDYAPWAAHYGAVRPTDPGAYAIPEPSAITALAMTIAVGGVSRPRLRYPCR